MVRVLPGFKRFPGFRDLALNPYHDLLESPAPAFISHYHEFPDWKEGIFCPGKKLLPAKVDSEG